MATTASTTTPPSVPTIMIAPGVLDAMRRETMAYAGAEQETGGILVGKWIALDTVLVLGATDAGQQADHQQYTFAVDVDHANAKLDEYRALYPGADYIGEWHKHPPTLDRPSGGDLQTVRRQMTDPSYPDRMINPISVVRNGQPTIYFYYIDRTRSEFQSVTAHEVAPPEFSQYFARPAVNLPPLGARTTPVVAFKPAPPWWLRKGGAERLVGEKEELTDKGFAVIEDDAVELSRVMTVVRKNAPRAWSLRLECHGNYPENPPRILDMTRNGRSVRIEGSSPTMLRWQPTDSLAEVCNDLQRDPRRRTRGIAFGVVAAVVILAVVIIAAVLIQVSNSTNAQIDALGATNTAAVLEQTVSLNAVNAKETLTANVVAVTAALNETAIASSQTQLAKTRASLATLIAGQTATAAVPTAAPATVPPAPSLPTITTTVAASVPAYMFEMSKKSSADFGRAAQGDGERHESRHAHRYAQY